VKFLIFFLELRLERFLLLVISNCLKNKYEVQQVQTESVVLQAIFHYRACLSSNETVLDDSRKIGKDGRPFELLIGKKFSLEMWEEAIQTMRVGEVALFVSPIQVNASLFFFNFYLIKYTFYLQFALH
jgi:hypothetical protein